MSGELRCPKCSCPLDTAQLPERVSVESCPHCYGVFYDLAELAIALELAGAVDTHWACPKCGGVMRTGRYRGALELDQCTGCSGVWFDAGEVAKLRKLSGVEGIAKGSCAPEPAAPARLLPAAATAAMQSRIETQREQAQTAAKAGGPAAGAKYSAFPEIPEGSSLSNPDESRCPVVRTQGRTYEHFQTSEPVVTYVVGEFPWRVKVGERVRARDFICPPFLVSQEVSGKEVVWSEGVYLEPEEVWAGFKLPDSPPPPMGVAPAQPNPHDGHMTFVKVTAWSFTALIVAAAFALSAVARNELLLEKGFAFVPTAAEKAVVTEVFELKGHTSNVEVTILGNLNNQWAYISMALINADTDEALDFGREISFYSGVDDEGRWTEGSPADTVYLPQVPSGRYYMRLEPETDTGTFNYEVRVRRDVPRRIWAILAVLLIWLPAAWVLWRRYVFEQQRWMESDHPWTSDDDDDDD